MRSGRIDFSAVEALCSSKKDIMVYGFHQLLYWDKINILREFKQQDYDTHTYATPPTCELHTQSLENQGALEQCMTTLSNLLLYNFMQIQSGKPPMPLIFIIGADIEACHIKLNYDRIAKPTDMPGYTDAELRHCYELYSGTSGDLRQVMDLTFHFFTLKNADEKSKPYKLEQVPPFWHDPVFIKTWQQYNRKHTWKTIAKRKLQKVLPGTLFHQPAVSNDSVASRVKQRRIATRSTQCAS